MKYSCVDVEQLSPICNNQFLVKENDTCIVASQFLILIVLYLGEVNNLELYLDHDCITYIISLINSDDLSMCMCSNAPDRDGH